MDEAHVLDFALQNCQQIQRSMHQTLNMVRRLIKRYNPDSLLQNYKGHVADIWSGAPKPKRAPRPLARQPKQRVDKPQSLSVVPLDSAAAFSEPEASESEGQLLAPRSSHELCISSSKLNYEWIKVKRSMEAVLMQMQRANEIGKRQKDYVHEYAMAGSGRARFCWH